MQSPPLRRKTTCKKHDLVQSGKSSLKSWPDVKLIPQTNKPPFRWVVNCCIHFSCLARSVIVSQWTQMLSVVERHLVEADFRCSTIRGDIPPKRRAEMVDLFNNDPLGPEVGSPTEKGSLYLLQRPSKLSIVNVDVFPLLNFRALSSSCEAARTLGHIDLLI